MAGLLAPPIKFRYVDNNGASLVNGKVYTYISGSSTLLTTYSDAALTSANTNPVILDSRGEADIYLSPGKAYRFTVKTSADVLIETTDGVYGSSPAGTSNYVNVVSYGADNTGVADSYSAIVAAIAAAHTSKTFVYFPAGTYKSTSTSGFTNSGAGNMMGFIGDGKGATTITMPNCTTHGIHFTNVPYGFRLEQFSVTGPGQTASGTGKGIMLDVDGTGTTNTVYGINMTEVFICSFPGDGLYMQVPIVSNFRGVQAQSNGGRGFAVVPYTNPNVGGTSTTWTNCYANDNTVKGYYFESHVYATMTGCAMDWSPIGYHFYGCNGFSVIACGNESGGQHTPASTAVGFLIENCFSGFSITSPWMYYFSNTGSVGIRLTNSTNVTVIGPVFLKETIQTTYDIEIGTGCTNNTFINAINLNRTNGRAAFNDLTSGNGGNDFSWGNNKGVAYYNIPDTYTNVMYANGNISVTGPGSAGANAVINLYQQGVSAYPKALINSTPALAFGSGTGAVDTILSRTGTALLAITGSIDTSLTVKAASNPQFILNNTGQTQLWAVSGDNGKGLAFYDVTAAITPLYVQSVANGGKTNIKYGIEAASGATGWAGQATLVAGTKVVTCSRVKANSIITVTCATPSGAQGSLSAPTAGIVAGTSFTINSTSGTDTSLVNWSIIDLV